MENEVVIQTHKTRRLFATADKLRVAPTLQQYLKVINDEIDLFITHSGVESLRTSSTLMMRASNKYKGNINYGKLVELNK